jgi:ABC-type nitrate/sulfonate/bicarbonate transport system permease component
MSANAAVTARRRSRGRRKVSLGLRDKLLGVAAVVVAVAVWQFIASKWFTPAFFPTPIDVGKQGWTLFRNGDIYPHIWASMRRILLGFFLGSAIGAPIGLLMGSIRPVRAFLDPYVQFFRFIPSIAWLTPMVIWFGIGETPKVMIILYTTVFMVVLNSAIGVTSVPQNMIWASQSLGASQIQVFLRVIVPATIPYILAGMRLAMGNSFTAVVAAEMVAANTGLGALIFTSRIFFQTNTIFVVIVLLGVLGYASDRAFRFLINKFAPQYAVMM